MIKIIDDNNELLKLEQLRLNSLKKPNQKEYQIECLDKTYMGRKLKSGKAIAISYYKDNKLVGGCYVSNFANSIYIEWIFIDRNYREQGIASELLKFIDENIPFFSDYYSENFTQIKLEAIDNSFFNKRGYNNSTGSYLTKPTKKRK